MPPSLSSAEARGPGREVAGFLMRQRASSNPMTPNRPEAPGSTSPGSGYRAWRSARRWPVSDRQPTTVAVPPARSLTWWTGPAAAPPSTGRRQPVPEVRAAGPRPRQHAIGPGVARHGPDCRGGRSVGSFDVRPSVALTCLLRCNITDSTGRAHPESPLRVPTPTPSLCELWRSQVRGSKTARLIDRVAVSRA